MTAKFAHRSFHRRLTTMLAVDTRRMFTTRLFYILLGIAFAVPILILVMTSAVGGESGMVFENVWQIIGSADGGMTMDMTSMCNINLLYFGACVLVGLFVAQDFRSGYAKNLFTVRAKRGEYVVSKTIVCFVACALLLAAFFVGAMLGGKIAGLSFALGSITMFNLTCCLLAKIFLMAVFVAIYLLMSVIAKARAWLSITAGFMAGMLLFMMIPMMTPLNATIIHAGMCIAGGILFSAGIGAASAALLKKSDLV